MRRLILLAIVALCLTPGTWVRSPLPAVNHSQRLSFKPLTVTQTKLGELDLRGAWQLLSPNSGFGSYSAMISPEQGVLLAASDSGGILRFPPPGLSGEVSIGRFAGRSIRRKKLIDIESLTRDPASGRIWAGYEGTNSIERLEADFTDGRTIRPAAMAQWSNNSGPEAMVRLADGRFIVLSEGPRRWLGDAYPALLFPDDPVEGAVPMPFLLHSQGGFAPVDIAQIPDGRVLILLRSFSLGFPPAFAVKLIVADPAEITLGGQWSGRPLATIGSADLQDNYEGMAIVPLAGGQIDIWLISDDNNATFQRSLLLNLQWNPAARQPTTQKAREKPARPSKPTN
ncbi:MAG: esterase-like activity of phytase family protein [Pontixanthobacter sp.]